MFGRAMQGLGNRGVRELKGLGARRRRGAAAPVIYSWDYNIKHIIYSLNFQKKSEVLKLELRLSHQTHHNRFTNT